MTATPGSAELIASIATMLEGHSFGLRCGEHHEEVATRIVDEMLRRLAAKPAEEGMLLQLAEWCRIEREKLGAIDGYDYRSGEEFGLRRAQNEIERRASTTGAPKP